MRHWMIHFNKQINDCIAKGRRRAIRQNMRDTASRRRRIPLIPVGNELTALTDDQWAELILATPPDPRGRRCQPTPHMILHCKVVCSFIRHAVQEQLGFKWKLLWCEVPLTDAGKSTLIKLLDLAGYNVYNLIRGDGRWFGQEYKNNVDLFACDSLIPEDFNTRMDGLPVRKFEELCGGQPSTLAVRGQSPLSSRGQPVFALTQHTRDEFEELNSTTRDAMFEARAVYRFFDPAQSETLWPIIYYLKQHFGIDQVWPNEHLTRESLGFVNDQYNRR